MTLRRGQVFGEMSLISGRPHDVTAIAGDRCVLLESPHTAVRKLMRAEASVRDYLDRNYILRALRLFLLVARGARNGSQARADREDPSGCRG